MAKSKPVKSRTYEAAKLWPSGANEIRWPHTATYIVDKTDFLNAAEFVIPQLKLVTVKGTYHWSFDGYNSNYLFLRLYLDREIHSVDYVEESFLLKFDENQVEVILPTHPRPSENLFYSFLALLDTILHRKSCFDCNLTNSVENEIKFSSILKPCLNGKNGGPWPLLKLQVPLTPQLDHQLLRRHPFRKRSDIKEGKERILIVLRHLRWPLPSRLNQRLPALPRQVPPSQFPIHRHSTSLILRLSDHRVPSCLEPSSTVVV